MYLPFALSVFVLVAAVALASADARAARLFAFAKPLATLALLAVAGVAAGDPAHNWVLAGLVASALGDAALLRSEATRFFLAGVALFLLAHVGYTIAFTLLIGSRFSLGLADIGALLMGATAAGACATWLLRRVHSGIPPELRGSVRAYAVVVTLMFGSACMVFVAPFPLHVSAAALAGALLFYLSDIVLAVHQFAGPLRRGQTVNLGLYWTGQLGIALVARWTGEHP